MGGGRGGCQQIPLTVYYYISGLFHKTQKTSLHMLAGLCKDVFMFYETEPIYGDLRLIKLLRVA